MSLSVSYKVHIENMGWTNPVVDGATAGTTGLALRMEAIDISLLNLGTLNLGLEYQAHVQNQGWQALVTSGTAGTVGQFLRLEALRISLTGTDAPKYSIKYRVHVENIGWQIWMKDGETAGTEGLALRAEAIEIIVVPLPPDVIKSVPDDIIQAIPILNRLCAGYSTHIQNMGWTLTSTDGRLSGRVGLSLRMEAIRINILNKGSLNLGVEYQASVQNVGWQSIVANNATAGTTDQSLYLEALRIRLTGTNASSYAVWYRVHIQNEGWQDWRHNWEIAGTTGQDLRAEAIEIIITLASDSLIRTITSEAIMSTVYRSHVENIGWDIWVKNGQKSGTTGQHLRLEAFQLKLANLDGVSLGVSYRAYVQNTGWQSWVANGVTAGTTSQSIRLEAFQITLTGASAANYSIQYRVHVENIGWMPWCKDGATAGTTGQALEAEAIAIVITRLVDLNMDVTNNITNKAPYYQIRAVEFPSTDLLIHDIRTANVVTSVKITNSPNSPQILSFMIDPTHACYDDLRELRTICMVYEVSSTNVSTQIYEGRVLTDNIDFNNLKTVTCEGELSYLLDSVQRPHKYENCTVEQWLTMVLDNHNQCVTVDKRFHMGIVTVLDTKDDALRENDYINTKALIEGTLLKSLGGYLVIEHVGSLRFLNYMENNGVVNTQSVSYGVNLLDYHKQIDGSPVCTALVPYGKVVDDKPLTVALVNSNCDFIYDVVAVQQFGWIMGMKSFPDIQDAATLLVKGTDYLSSVVREGLSLTLTAVDLALVNINIQKINAGDSVRCISKPHNIDLFLTASERVLDLEDPSKDTVTLGTKLKSLTDSLSGSYSANSDNYLNSVGNTSQNMTLISNDVMISWKVTADTVVGLDSRVDSAEIAITAHGVTIAATTTAVSGLDTRVDSAEVKITPTAIVSTVRSSTSYTNDQGLKVNKATVISEINQSAEAITINASKLNFTGYSTFASTVASIKAGLGNTGYTTINGGNIDTGTMDFTGALNGYTSGLSTGFSVNSSGVMTLPISAPLYFSDSTYRYIIGDLSGGGLTIYNQEGHIRLTPVGTGHQTQIGALYATNQPINIPISTSINTFEYINTDYMQANTKSNGNFGVTWWVSDEKLKMNIADAEISAITEIGKIKVRSFDWKENEKKNACGFVANEIETDLGEKYVLKIKQPDDTYLYQLKAHEFIPLLTKGLQELTEQVNTQAKEIDTLKNQLAEIMKKLDL
jgi:uncharacterized protein YjdB